MFIKNSGQIHLVFFITVAGTAPELTEFPFNPNTDYWNQNIFFSKRTLQKYVLKLKVES